MSPLPSPYRRRQSPRPSPRPRLSEREVGPGHLRSRQHRPGSEHVIGRQLAASATSGRGVLVLGFRELDEADESEAIP